MTAFISSPRCVEHETGPLHPERADRIRAIHRAVREAGLVDSRDPFPEFKLDLGPMKGSGVKLLEIAPIPAEEKWLLLAHTAEHVKKVKETCARGGGMLDSDTVVAAISYEIAMLSLGGVLTACDVVIDGRAKRAFAAGRPPGHHAEPDRAMGFCLFANVAIGARYLQKKYGIERVAIVDFDVHHGNGTQAVLENDPTVYFVSMHEDPKTCYPGTGFEWEIGVGRGKGFTMNVPFRPGAGDAEYLEAMRNRVVPAVKKFSPQVLMISAGFDAHADDPLAHIELSETGFEEMTGHLVGIADKYCEGRVVSVLEGGYDLQALGRSVVRHLVAME